MIKALRGFPGLTILLGLTLQIPPRHIDAKTVTVDMIECVFNINIDAANCNRDYQFDFEMYIF